jgi:hypothetical protein
MDFESAKKSGQWSVDVGSAIILSQAAVKDRDQAFRQVFGQWLKVEVLTLKISIMVSSRERFVC